MTNLSIRKVVTISIEDKETDLLLAEQLVVTFPSKKKGSIKHRDLGSLCYKIRGPIGTGTSKNIPRKVDINSLDTTRRESINNYFDYLRNQWTLRNSSSLIDKNSINAYRYADFCDGLLNGEEVPIFKKSSLKSYIRWLIHRTSLPKNNKNYITLSTARTYQNSAIIFLSAAMRTSKSELVSGIKLIKNVPKLINTTSQPDEEDLTFAMKTHYSLFIGLASLILDYKKLPYAIEMSDQVLYCLADSTCYFTSKKARRERKVKNITFDYENGIYFSEAEVTAGIKINTSAWHGRLSCLKRAFESTESANLSQRSKARIMFANIACQAFYMMFIANTGANDQVARDILWNEDSSISNLGNSWRGIVIKNRGATEIQIEIGSKFKRLFNLYLKLREWLVDGRQAEYLFMYERRDGVLEQFNADCTSSYRLKLQKNYPEMKWITPRELRKNKGLYVLRKSKNDIHVASQMLGNTPETFKKHYAEGSLKDSVIEFEALWNSIRQKKISDIRHKNIPPEPITVLETNTQFNDIPVGSCLEFKQPKKSLEFTDKAITPNCLRAEGCLFCSHFAIHSSKDDLHKVLSCQFILKSLRPVFDNEDHFLSEYGAIINRIDEILIQISEKGEKEKNLVNKTKEDVYQKGKLNNYWNRRLNMLIEMEVNLEFD